MNETPTPQRTGTVKEQAKPWGYNEYRATLTCNGKFFALVTPNGRDALTKDDAATLLQALNAQSVLKERHKLRGNYI